MNAFRFGDNPGRQAHSADDRGISDSAENRGIADSADNRGVRRFELVALLFILLLAFGLRVYRLGAQAIWWDESLSVYRATRDLATVLSNTILIQQVVTHDTLPPFYFVLLHFAAQAFGATEFALRFFSLAVNIATLPLLYGLARRWFSPGAGLVAAFLGALSPFYIWYAQEARPYTLVLFWGTLAVYALTRAFAGRGVNLAIPSTSPKGTPWRGGAKASDREVARRPSPGWLIVYLLSAIAMLYTHYIAVFLIPFHALVVALFVWSRGRARGWILLPVVPLGSTLFLIPLVASSAAGNKESGPYFVPLFTVLRDLLNSFSVGITVDLVDAVWIDLVLLGVFLLGVVSSMTSRTFRRAIFVLAFVLVPVLGIQLASYVRPLYLQSRYLIAISPGFYLGVAAGVVALGRRWKLLALPALAVFLIGATVSLGNLYNDRRFGKDDHRAWSEYLSEHARPGDFLILDSPHTEELYRYYARDSLPWRSLPIKSANGADAPAADLAAVRDAYRRYPRVWFLEMDVPFDDPERRIEALLTQEGVRLEEVDFAGTSTEISLSLFVPALPAATAVPHPLEASFDKLRLLGFDSPASIESGGRTVVDLYWRVDERVGEDYGVSLRLVDDAGARWGQWDIAPLGNRAGTTTWEPMRVMVDEHDLPVAVGTRPGAYRLEVQVYHPATGAVIGDAITLREVEVTRPRVPIDPSRVHTAERIDQTFGGYRLLGSDWPDGGTRPGDSIPVSIYIQIVEPTSQDLHLALQLVQRIFPFLGPTQVHAQVDTVVSARGLQVGDILRHNVTLRVPAEAGGDYELKAVLPNARAVDLGDVHVQSIERTAIASNISHPQTARVGDSVTFLGYDLNPTRVRGGETIQLTLYWRADKTMTSSYKVFTHVLDADNQIVGQQDSIPAGGTRPTTGWASGEVIADSYAITLQDLLRPGKYGIEIGFYDEATGVRLPTFGGDGAALGDRILLPGIDVP